MTSTPGSSSPVGCWSTGTRALAIVLRLALGAPVAKRGQVAGLSLAALLLVTAWNMTEPHKWASYARGRRSDIVLLLLTLLLPKLTEFDPRPR